MRVLLDTHTLLWSSMDSPRLSNLARALLTDPQTVAVCSLASFWEISIKFGLGRLELMVPLEQFFQEVRARFEMLPIEDRHCLKNAELPLHHRDPFDRMLIAQALNEQMTILGDDAAFDAYGVQRIW